MANKSGGTWTHKNELMARGRRTVKADVANGAQKALRVVMSIVSKDTKSESEWT